MSRLYAPRQCLVLLKNIFAIGQILLIEFWHVIIISIDQISKISHFITSYLTKTGLFEVTLQFVEFLMRNRINFVLGFWSGYIGRSFIFNAYLITKNIINLRNLFFINWLIIRGCVCVGVGEGNPVLYTLWQCLVRLQIIIAYRVCIRALIFNHQATDQTSKTDHVLVSDLLKSIFKANYVVIHLAINEKSCSFQCDIWVKT